MNNFAAPRAPKSCRKSLLLGLLACTGFGITSAQAGPVGPPPIRVLIVAGTNSFAQQAASVLNTDLTNDGFTVTIVDTCVPILEGYTQVFDVRWTNEPAFSDQDMNRYLA